MGKSDFPIWNILRARLAILIHIQEEVISFLKTKVISDVGKTRVLCIKNLKMKIELLSLRTTICLLENIFCYGNPKYAWSGNLGKKTSLGKNTKAFFIVSLLLFWKALREFPFTRLLRCANDHISNLRVGPCQFTRRSGLKDLNMTHPCIKFLAQQIILNPYPWHSSLTVLKSLSLLFQSNR